MALDIPVGKKYKIQSDEYNIIVNKKRIVSKLDGSKEESWGTQNKYVKSVKKACETILVDHARCSEATSLKQLIEESKEINKVITEALQVSGVEI